MAARRYSARERGTVRNHPARSSSMPFTAEQFFDVFRRYNLAVSPAQWLLNGLAVVAVLLTVSKSRRGSRAIALILAALWTWSAVAYHFAFFTSINRAAWLFGGLFVIEGGALAWYGVRTDRLHFALARDLYGISGIIIATFALVGYPLLAYRAGQRYPAMPTFGLPCPTTIFTLGLLVLAKGPLPLAVLVIPLAWSLLGTTAVVRLGVPEDACLLVAAFVTAVLVLWRDRWIVRRRDWSSRGKQPLNEVHHASPR